MKRLKIEDVKSRQYVTFESKNLHHPQPNHNTHKKYDGTLAVKYTTCVEGNRLKQAMKQIPRIQVTFVGDIDSNEVDASFSLMDKRLLNPWFHH